jgi:hypothetical protein
MIVRKVYQRAGDLVMLLAVMLGQTTTCLEYLSTTGTFERIITIMLASERHVGK